VMIAPTTNAMSASPPAIRESATLFSCYVAGVTPHPTQALFLECRAPVKVAACGRRWGKSTAASLDVIHLAVAGDAQGKPTRQMIVAPSSDQTRIIGDEVERLLLTGPLAPVVANVVHAPFFEVELVNGSIIMCRSAANEGKYLRGRSAHRVVVDEAAFVSEHTLQEAILPMLADTNGQLVLISTPFGHNAFWEFFMRGQGGDPACRSFQFPSYDNPHVSRAYIDAQRVTMTDLQFRGEWLAEFLDDQATVFRWALIEQAIQGELAQPIPGHRYALGWDPAKYHDRSAVIVLDTTFARWRVVACETLEGRDYGRQLAQVGALAQAYNNAFVVMDGTGNVALAEQVMASGLDCEAVIFTNPVKQGLIDNLVLALEHGLLTFPHLPALIQELRFYEFRLTDAGNVKLGAPDRAGAFDDLTTALALAVKSVMQPPERVEVVSLAEQLGVAGYQIDPRYGHQQGMSAPSGPSGGVSPGGHDPYDMSAFTNDDGAGASYGGTGDDPLTDGWTIDPRY